MKMTNEENVKLFEELQKYPENSKEYNKIFAEIVEKNNNLVLHVAKKYYGGNKYLFDDMISEGKIGLMQGVRKFDFNYGVPFSSFAASYIEGFILNFLRHENKYYFVKSLDEPLSTDEENDLTLHDSLPSDFDVEERVIERERKNNVHQTLENLVSKLSPREAFVIKKRYMSGLKVVSQVDFAKYVGRSRTIITYIEGNALNNLKKLATQAELEGE